MIPIHAAAHRAGLEVHAGHGIDYETVKPVAAVAPKVTAAAPVKLVPVMVTVVPPPPGPEVGEIDVTVGAAT